MPQLFLKMKNEVTSMRLPQLASIRILLWQPQENVLNYLASYSFGSSLTQTGSSSMLELLETIRNCAAFVVIKSECD
jgi:hypothetical protein